jgi:hypothetical protein
VTKVTNRKIFVSFRDLLTGLAFAFESGYLGPECSDKENIQFKLALCALSEERRRHVAP